MNNIKTIIAKEFKDIIRDRKTLLMTILIPAIIMPLLYSFIFNQVSDMNSTDEDNKTVIFLESDSPQIKTLFKESKIWDIKTSKDPIHDTFDGKATLYIHVSDHFEDQLIANKNPSIDFYYDTTSTTAQTSFESASALFNQYQKQLAKSILVQNNINTSLVDELNIKTHAKDQSVDPISVMLLGMIVPMMVIGYSGMGTVSIATDLGAGEKERGTLEPLLSTSVSRKDIFIAKTFVTSCFGIMTSLLSTLGLYFVFQFTLPESLGVTLSMSFTDMGLILLLAILYNIFASAIMLLISTYARSTKEAGTYLTPCTLIPMILSILTMYSDPNTISIAMMNIPIYNVVTVIKEIIIQQLNYTHFFMTIGWSVIYVIVSVAVATRLYNKEEVIFR